MFEIKFWRIGDRSDYNSFPVVANKRVSAKLIQIRACARCIGSVGGSESTAHYDLIFFSNEIFVGEAFPLENRMMMIWECLSYGVNELLHRLRISRCHRSGIVIGKLWMD
jgi:hypothetical protein